MHANRVLTFVFLIVFNTAFWTSGCAGLGEPLPLLSVTPSNVSVSTNVGSASSQMVTITNLSISNVSISQAIVNGTGFSVAGLTTPFSLSPSQRMSFKVEFVASTAGSVNGSLAIVTDARHRPVEVPLYGHSTSSGAPVASVTVSPASVSVAPGERFQFAATVQGTTTNDLVAWAASTGTITSLGLYSASASSGKAQVTATSMADPSKSASAIVTVTTASTPSPTPPATSVTISPASASTTTSGTIQFAATVQGTVSTKSVTWKASSGSITASGLYTAPSSPGTATVTATSDADSTKSTSAVVAVTVGTPLQITTSTLADGIVQLAYTATLAAKGSTPPYSWSITSGSLPPGLSFSTVGTISGTPTTAGSYSVEMTVSDSSGQTATSALSITVNAAGKVPNSFFGLSVFGTPTCADNTCNPATSYPLNGGIVPGTLGKIGFIAGYHIEPTCDGGMDPNNSCYQWSKVDLWVNFAQTYGYTLIYDWDLPPGWQCGQASSTSCTHLPSNISYMSHFATALATRYAGKIQYYETGNEVDQTGIWTGTCADLVLLHNTIHDAIKAADPSAIVGAPNMTGYSGIGTACDSSPVNAGTDSGLWIQNFLQTQDRNGALPKVDTVGLHTYQIVQPALHNVAQRFLDEYNQFRSIMTAVGIPRRAPLLVTEGGFGPDDNGNCTAPLSSTACLTAADQIAYIGRWLVLGASTWADGGGQLPSWYAYDINYGTLNGPNGMNPLNASAYGQMETWIKGATFQQQCHSGSPSTVFVCDFTNGVGQQTEIIFNDNNGASASYPTPGWATTYQALLGSALAISGGSVTVGDTPILLK
jgi:hypothetical protein